jgi:FixJ family two-component response regulator
VIADRLHLSQRTVEAYRASMFEKLEAGSVADLVRLRMIGGN